ncbi:MAG: tetratricopeptide repeat protein [Nibricoccus sp.]
MSDAGISPRASAVNPCEAGTRVCWQTWLFALCLIVAVASVYHNSFQGVMVFDDRPTIINNPTLREWRNPGAVLRPPLDTTVSGRPVANVTFAANYAFGELRPWGYHLVNVLIHGAAALALFGGVRRILLLPRLAGCFGKAATPLAGLVALLWAVHPLQTESVTYIVQRVEALMALFYLLAVYCFLRAAENGRTEKFWAWGAVASVWFGVGTKEVAATAPLVILLIDRTLMAASFSEIWRRRRWLYAGLLASWLLQGWLILQADQRSGTAGFGTASWWSYLLTQCKAIVIYLKLVVWPNPLVFDYGRGLVTQPGAVLWQGLFLIAVFCGAVAGFLKGRLWSVAALAFFIILAPSSSVVPIATQTMAEHRMYLPLAPVLLLLVLVGYRWAGRWVWPVGLAVAVIFGVMTVNRNALFKDELTLWSKTALDCPSNARAICAHGRVLFEAGRTDEALDRYKAALKLDDGYFDAHNNLGIALLSQRKMEEARSAFEAALRIKPEDPEAANNLGMLFHSMGRTAEAVKLIEGAAKRRPEYADAHSNLCIVLPVAGRFEEAIAHGREAIRLKPENAEAHSNLGIVLFASDKTDEAIREYEQALRLKPTFAEAHLNLGIARQAQGRIAEAADCFREALRLTPDYFEARNNLGNALAAQGDLAGAAVQYEAAYRLMPSSADVCFNLGNTYLKLRRLDEAMHYGEEAVRLRPEHVESRTNFGSMLAMQGKSGAALPHLAEAVRLKPDSPKAHYLLGNVYVQLGRSDEARNCYEKALQLKPDYLPARQNLERLR